MDQEKLERRVVEIFEKQGFEVAKNGNRFTASRDDDTKELEVYSSGNYRADEVEPAEGTDIVFVDQELSSLEERLDAELSVLEEREETGGTDLPSYEIIGSVAVINELVGFSREEAVEAITSQHPNVETVLLKTGQLSGEFRVGEYETLHGGETETVHSEFGCRFRLDPTEVYYSERFSTERDRVVSQVGEGERVLVMFAGVGPFAVMAARNAEPSEVVAVEKNPRAAEYLRQNVELNSVEDTVVPVEGDVAEVLPELGNFDRIAMPLPGAAQDYLSLALEHLEPGGTLHYYRFVEDGREEEIHEEIAESAREAGVEIDIIDEVECGAKGPGTARICFDLRRRQDHV